jgi:hypothetical protein
MTTNYIGIYHNVSRAYEIAKLGRHTIGFAYSNDFQYSLTPAEIKAIADFFGIVPSSEADIICDMNYRPQASEIVTRRKSETLENIHTRVKDASNFPKPEIVLTDGSESLLRTAIDRLNLTIPEVETIYKVSQTIAQLGFSSTIRTEHLAEAIQYRAIEKDLNIYGKNTANDALTRIGEICKSNIPPSERFDSILAIVADFV